VDHVEHFWPWLGGNLRVDVYFYQLDAELPGQQVDQHRGLKGLDG
jgi:hypothetical protein